MNKTVIRIATDVGGTFTDLVCFRSDPETGASSISAAKVSTTPPNYEKGVLEVLEKGKVDPAATEFLAHGTTVVINALTERKGVKVGLITTQGFRDILEIARGNRPDFFNLHYEKPKPFVPRYLRRELPGRMSYRGEIMEPLDLSDLAGILQDFKEDQVQAIAICFLHSYANPVHEIETETAVRELWPDLPAVSSHRIAREWREYERTNTTVLSAYIQPVAERYLNRLSDELANRGFSGSPYVMQSNCGVDSLEAAAQIPITMIESGPSSGVWGAAVLGKLIGDNNIIALDIGGTTAKCSLIENGNIKIVTDYWIERSRKSAGYPVMVPVVDIVEIGNGGGSIAWVDEFGKLHIGPQSAGAIPGPASYGKGGKQATTTDANLWLGRINPNYFCGGELEADMNAVESALSDVGTKLGVSISEAARGIVRLANNNMVNALKLVSLNRGFDPRDFTLAAFGGGGGMHAVALAQELGIRKVIIPADASVFSAWGMIMSDLRRDYIVTNLTSFNAVAAPEIEKTLKDIESSAINQFIAEGVKKSAISFKRFGKFRYQNQEHTTEVDLGDQQITTDVIDAISSRFHIAYEREYTYRLDTPVEMVGVHVVATAKVGKMNLTKKSKSDKHVDSAQKAVRQVDYALEGIHKATILDGTRLLHGMTINGPAIVEDPGSTTVIHPGNKAEIDGFGNVIIYL